MITFQGFLKYLALIWKFKAKRVTWSKGIQAELNWNYIEHISDY